MSNLIKKITNIQRFELLEERLGIAISGVNAVLVNFGNVAEPIYYLEINAEVIALNGGEIEHDFQVNITASDSAGEVLGGAADSFLQDWFFGIDRLHVEFKVYTTDVEAIKVFPVKN